MRFRVRVAAALVTVAGAPGASADDCSTLSRLTDAFAAAHTTVVEARTALAEHGDVATTLASARVAVAAADVELAGVVAPRGVVQRRRRMHAQFVAATRWIAAAQRRPTRTRNVSRWLVAADRATATTARWLGVAAAASACGSTPVGPVADMVFPADNWWNVDVTARRVLPNSDAVIDFIGRAKAFHADFGTDFGIPYVVLDAPQPLSQPTFDYDDESDVGAPGHAPGYPIPDAAKTTPGYIEGGVAGGGPDGDRHLILVDRTTHFLFELYAAQWTGSKWTAGSGAVYDLTSNARRPEGWTSADAAGLAIFPGLVRADEVFDKGEIRHALRFTVRATKGYVFPASHDATHGAGGDLRPPLGLRVRMKPDVDLSAMSAPARVVFTAMKKYGLILADNGSDWYVTGAPDPRWDDERMHDDFARITGNDFEAVE